MEVVVNKLGSLYDDMARMQADARIKAFSDALLALNWATANIRACTMLGDLGIAAGSSLTQAAERSGQQVRGDQTTESHLNFLIPTFSVCSLHASGKSLTCS